MKIVFLIDDDPDDREIFAESLFAGFPSILFHEAENGADAFEKLNSGTVPKPDLIFLDLNMPIMDGRIFLQQIKKDTLFQDVPVIIYTTSSSEIDKSFAKDHKADLFLTKQYSMVMVKEDIQTAVQKFLNL